MTSQNDHTEKGFSGNYSALIGEISIFVLFSFEEKSTEKFFDFPVLDLYFRRIATEIFLTDMLHPERDGLRWTD